jgi:ABC-type glycerol-3-phosphate transport system substrate-binding protein
MNGKLLTAVFIPIATLLAACGGGGATDAPAASKTSFTGTANTFRVVNPASVNVNFTITNEGSTAGIPNCKVKVQDESLTYSGYDYPIITTPIAPGETLSGNINLTITNEGANYITSGGVTCS